MSSSSVKDSFVITSRQFGIHSCLQCVFHSLVHNVFLESIILFEIEGVRRVTESLEALEAQGAGEPLVEAETDEKE